MSVVAGNLGLHTLWTVEQRLVQGGLVPYTTLHPPVFMQFRAPGSEHWLEKHIVNWL